MPTSCELAALSRGHAANGGNPNPEPDAVAAPTVISFLSTGGGEVPNYVHDGAGMDIFDESGEDGYTVPIDPGEYDVLIDRVSGNTTLNDVIVATGEDLVIPADPSPVEIITITPEQGP